VIRKLAVLWCLVYGTLGIAWAFGAPGFPFGADDPRGAETGNWLAHAIPGPTGAALSVGCAIALFFSVLPGGRLRGYALLGLATLLAFTVADVRVLQNLTYALRGYFGLFDWPLLNQVLCLAGAALLARLGVLVLRRSPCGTCQLPDARPGERERWVRIGRWAVLIAVLAQLPYATQRAAWNLGIPLGVSQQFVDGLHADLIAKGQSPLSAWSLVLPDVIGVLLTLGLVMRWGERFPRWVPVLGDRRVPMAMAVIPASLVAVVVTVAGEVALRFTAEDGFNGAGAPAILWLPWGLALGLATFAYAQRRRSRCACTAARPRPGTRLGVGGSALGRGREVAS
jgi:hypothetical protein